MHRFKGPGKSADKTATTTAREITRTVTLTIQVADAGTQTEQLALQIQRGIPNPFADEHLQDREAATNTHEPKSKGKGKTIQKLKEITRQQEEDKKRKEEDLRARLEIIQLFKEESEEYYEEQKEESKERRVLNYKRTEARALIEKEKEREEKEARRLAKELEEYEVEYRAWLDEKERENEEQKYRTKLQEGKMLVRNKVDKERRQERARAQWLTNNVLELDKRIEHEEEKEKARRRRREMQQRGQSVDYGEVTKIPPTATDITECESPETRAARRALQRREHDEARNRQLSAQDEQFAFAPRRSEKSSQTDNHQAREDTLNKAVANFTREAEGITEKLKAFLHKEENRKRAEDDTFSTGRDRARQRNEDKMLLSGAWEPHSLRQKQRLLHLLQETAKKCAQNATANRASGSD